MLASEVMLARLAAGAAAAGGAGVAAAGGAGAAAAGAAAAARVALQAPEVTEETKEPETEGTEAGTKAQAQALALALEADREAVARGHTEAEAAVAAVTVAATAAAAAGAEAAAEAEEAAAESETAVAAVEAAVEAGTEAELSDAAREEGSEAETRETGAETEPRYGISRPRSRPRRISWDDEASEEGGETTPVWLQHAAVAVACTSPDSLRPMLITSPSPGSTWTSPALGRMITDVQWRLEAAASPDDLSPDELMAASPHQITAASPDELTAASPKAVAWQVRRRQPTTTPLTAVLDPAADRHGRSAAAPRVILTSSAARPTPIRLSRCTAC